MSLRKLTAPLAAVAAMFAAGSGIANADTDYSLYNQSGSTLTVTGSELVAPYSGSLAGPTTGDMIANYGQGIWKTSNSTTPFQVFAGINGTSYSVSWYVSGSYSTYATCNGFSCSTNGNQLSVSAAPTSDVQTVGSTPSKPRKRPTR